MNLQNNELLKNNGKNSDPIDGMMEYQKLALIST